MLAPKVREARPGIVLQSGAPKKELMIAPSSYSRLQKVGAWM